MRKLVRKNLVNLYLYSWPKYKKNIPKSKSLLGDEKAGPQEPSQSEGRFPGEKSTFACNGTYAGEDCQAQGRIKDFEKQSGRGFDRCGALHCDVRGPDRSSNQGDPAGIEWSLGLDANGWFWMILDDIEVLAWSDQGNSSGHCLLAWEWDCPQGHQIRQCLVGGGTIWVTTSIYGTVSIKVPFL